MEDLYTWWRNALKGERQPVFENKPEVGFYKTRPHKNAPFVPVAIWVDENYGLIAVKNIDEEVTPEDVWINCAKYPVSQDDYAYYEENGKWESDIEPIQDITHNQPDEFEILKDEIEIHSTNALAWLEETTIDSQAKADKAAHYADKLRGLYKKAEAQRKNEKQPHLDAGKEVDTKYSELKSCADNAGQKLKSELTKFLAAEERKHKEEQRKLEEQARKEAEEEREKLEKEAAKSQQNIQVPTVEELVKPIAPVKVNAGGGLGNKKVSLRTNYKAEITDYPKALQHFADHTEVKELILKLANRIVRTEKENANIPGVSVKEVKKAA